MVFTVGFVAIRAYYHQPENENQTEIQGTREKWLATQFSLSLLCTHGWWLSQPSSPSMSYLAMVGALLMACSLPMLIWVHHSLGKFFSARLVLQPEHTIIQQGPYQYIRHPMYTVGFLYLIGAGLLSQSWIVGGVPFVAFSLLVGLRVQDEETMLQSVSAEYASYMKKTGRFLPKI